MKSRWITFKGKRILYCDYTGFGPFDFDLFKAEVDAVVALILREPKGSILALTDIRRTTASLEAVAMLKEAATQTTTYVRKQAVVGITGLKKILFDAVIRVSRQPAKPFSDLEFDEAQQWLIADE